MGMKLKNYAPMLGPIQRKLLFFIVIVALGYLAFNIISRFNPAPPRAITFSSGSAGGAYEQYAKLYAAELDKRGIKVTVLASTGSLDNYANLSGDTPKADVALVQSGLASAAHIESISGLAAVAYEPVWVFLRQDIRKNVGQSSGAQTLADLSTLKLAIPMPNSGSGITLSQLLKAAGLPETNPLWHAMPPTEAADALDSGKVQGVFTVSGIQAPVVKRLLASPHTLMSFAHAPAVSRTMPAFSVVTLPRGGISQAQDKPSTEVQLLATQALLVARADLHPALTYVLLDAAQTIHAGTSAIHALGVFPNAKTGDLIASDETQRYFKDGKPWLEKVLPFWLANFIARLLLVLIPMAAILFPIIKLEPQLEAFIAKRALQPRYFAAHAIEQAFFAEPKQDKPQYLAQLSDLEHVSSTTKVPSDHIKDRYALLQHIAVIKHRILSA